MSKLASDVTFYKLEIMPEVVPFKQDRSELIHMLPSLIRLQLKAYMYCNVFHRGYLVTMYVGILSAI